MKVDYNKPVEEVFTAFAAQLLLNLPNLSPLSSSEGIGIGNRNLKTLPSWCPDYSYSPSVSKLVITRENMQYGVPGFAASLCGTSQSGICRINGHILCASGKRIDTIAEACQPTSELYDIRTWFDDKHELTEIEGLLDVCLKLDSTYSLTKQDRIEVLWRTLLLDTDFFFGKSECKYPTDTSKFSRCFGAYIAAYSAAPLKRLTGKERESYLEVLQKCEATYLTSASLGLPSIPGILKYADESQFGAVFFIHRLFPEAKEFMVQSAVHCASRRLFITSQKWLGLGPQLLQPNDELWLLKHAAVPFILRAYGESQYQLVGEAYVHGIMYGELVGAPGGLEGFGEIEIV